MKVRDVVTCLGLAALCTLVLVVAGTPSNTLAFVGVAVAFLLILMVTLTKPDASPHHR